MNSIIQLVSKYTTTLLLSYNMSYLQKSQYVKGMKIPPLYTKHMVDT